MLTIVTLMTFASYKLTDFAMSTDYLMQEQSKRFFFDSSDEFTYKQDSFAVAVAISGFFDEQIDITDPEIGELKFYKKLWSPG